MNALGTIDRPLTHDPRKHTDSVLATSDGASWGAVSTAGATASPQNRTREMQLIPEAMARSHMHERQQEADEQRMVVRLAAARRMQRRAERASLRARRALAMAIMH